MKFNIHLYLIFLFLILTACSNPLGGDQSSIDTDYGNSSQLAEPAATGYEVIAGSLLSQTSTNGTHKVDVTVGVSTSQIRLISTQNKIVYLSVQGQMISDQ